MSCNVISEDVTILSTKMAELLFDPSNDRDLSDKIEIMLSKKDSWAELGEYNKEKVLSFGFDNAVAELTEIYKNICCNEEEK